MSRGAVIEARMNFIAGVINVQYGALIDVILELRDGPDTWSGDGVWTIEQFLAWRIGVSPSTASALTAIAGRADDLPICVQAFRDGRLSLDQAASIARKAPWWTDAESCDYATLMTVTQLRRVMRQYPFPELDDDGREIRPQPATESAADDAKTPEPDPAGDTADSDAATTDADPAATSRTGLDATAEGEPGTEPDDNGTSATDADAAAGHDAPAASGATAIDAGIDPFCSWSFGDDGTFQLHAHLDTETGHIVAAALDEARDRLFLDGQTDVTTADALREVCERSLDTIDSPTRRNRFKISMFFETNGNTTDTNGRRVPDAVRQHISCDSTITPILLDNGLPVSIGRAQHIVPDRTRTLIERRDHGVCRVPGCTSQLGLEVHHIIHWEHDGPTDTWNLILICGHHHRMHHRGSLGITGNADEIDGITFTNNHGRVIRQSGAAPNPPNEAPAPPPLPYEHPVGERLHTDMILFTPPAAHREELLQRTRANGGTATDYLNSFKT